MNLMGIGTMELVVILLVAFLVLGPGKSIDLAKRTGRVLGDLRRAFSEVTEAISAEERQRPQGQQPPPPPPPGVPSRPDLPDDDDNPPGGNAPGTNQGPPGRERNGPG